MIIQKIKEIKTDKINKIFDSAEQEIKDLNKKIFSIEEVNEILKDIRAEIFKNTEKYYINSKEA